MNDHIHRYVDDAQRLAEIHPESALSMARKAAEAVCKEVHQQRVGPTGPRATLDDLITKLAGSSTIPRKIQVPLRTIQAYGNHAAHDQGEQIPIDGRYIQPALQALETVFQWFLEDFSRGIAAPAVSAEPESLTQDAGALLLTGEAIAPSELASGTLSHGSSVFGREAELTALREAVQSVASGSARSGRAVLLSGPSGAGKSAIAESIIHYALSQRLRVARASCEPFHEGMSFYPVRELLRQLTPSHGLATDIGIAFGAGSSQQTIARLAEHPATDPSSRRDAMIATFVNQVFARVILDKSPIVIFVDDLERIDTGSVDALLCLFARLREGPVLILGAYRSDVVTATGASAHPLRPVISAVRRSEKPSGFIELAPLPEDQLPGLVESLLGAPCQFAPSFVRRLFEETEGNPLYVREALRTLSDERAGSDAAPLRLVDGAWKLVRQADSWEIPRSIEDAIASRLVSLSELDRSVLEAAAVIGRRFRFDVLLDLHLAEEEALIQALERHMNLDLIREVRNADDVFEFTHGKIREVLYNGMAGLRRARVHGQVADALEGHKKVIPAEEWDVTVGAHLFASRRYAASAPHLLRAGERALSLQAATDAAHHLSRALEAFEKSAETPRETLDRTRLLLGTALKFANQFVPAEAQFLLVLREGVDDYAKRWSLNHLGDVSLMQGRVHEALERYARCEVMARESGDNELLVEAAADLAELHMRQAEQLSGIDPVRSSEHAALYNQYLDLEQELAHEMAQPSALARAYRNSAKRARSRGDLDVAIALYEQSLEYIDEGLDSHRFLIPYAKALRLVGRHRDALDIVRRVLDWSRQIGARRSEAIARQYLGLILMEQSLEESPPDLAAAHCEMLQALGLHQEIGFEQGRRETEVDLAELAAHRGNRLEALEHLAAAVADGTTRAEADIAHAVLAQLRANGEPDRAERFRRAMAAMGISESPTASVPAGA